MGLFPGVYLVQLYLRWLYSNALLRLAGKYSRALFIGT